MSEHEEAAADAAPADDAATPRPLLRVVKGDPTPQEIAALVAVLSATAAQPAEEPPPARSEWASPARRMRPVLRPGPGAWRASAWPR